MLNSTSLFENEAIFLRIILNELKDGKLSSLIYFSILMKSVSVSLYNCDLSLPKMQVSFEANEVISSLQEMGIRKIFEQKGLPNVFNEDDAFVDEIRQKTIFKIDENGVESSSATGVKSMMLSNSRKVVIDTPFYFMLRHKAQNAILYMGKYVDPLN